MSINRNAEMNCDSREGITLSYRRYMMNSRTMTHQRHVLRFFDTRFYETLPNRPAYAKHFNKPAYAEHFNEPA